jgi:hypothetical protein
MLKIRKLELKRIRKMEEEESEDNLIKLFILNFN